jgi:hypothetical protein
MTELDDMGFADLAGAKAISRRMRLRSRLREAKTSITAALELLDHTIEPDRHAVAAGCQCGAGKVTGDRKGDVGGIAADVVERLDVREQQLLQGVDLILQLVDALSIGLGHGLFSIPHVTGPSDAGNAAHRLSAVPK